MGNTVITIIIICRELVTRVRLQINIRTAYPNIEMFIDFR